MTVCAAAICELTKGMGELDERKIVAITDTKASSQQGSNEVASTKSCFVSPKWLALFAGDDISPCLPICAAVDRAVTGQPRTIEIMTDAFEEQYQAYLSRLANSKVLGRWQLSMDKFLKEGRKRFGPDIFDKLCYAIEQVKLQCQFLVIGFDEDDEPHVFTVRNPGIAENHDTPGYYAIGDGASAAMSILGFFQQNVATPLWRTYYNVCSSKFMAESSASTVGRHSFLWTLGTGGSEMDLETANTILVATWGQWERGKPNLPREARQVIESALQVPKEQWRPLDKK